MTWAKGSYMGYFSMTFRPRVIAGLAEGWGAGGASSFCFFGFDLRMFVMFAKISFVGFGIFPCSL